MEVLNTVDIMDVLSLTSHNDVIKWKRQWRHARLMEFGVSFVIDLNYWTNSWEIGHMRGHEWDANLLMEI